MVYEVIEYREYLKAVWSGPPVCDYEAIKELDYIVHVYDQM